MRNKSIILVSCGHFEKNVIDKISSDLVYFFGFPLDVKECSLDLSSFYNPTRRQYDANLILQAIADVSSPDALKTMGHAFGLIHCNNPRCIMRSSTYAEDLDQKDLEFCYKCKRELDEKINGYRI
ncbi:MAG TPA: hypothetical protein DEQ09_09195 [Bacteroidales bacterium]|nr:hypothetical protein [Bacteroidales bacterium]